jgi:Flp pilus assembly protein TadG
MKRRLHRLRSAFADDRGVIGPAVAMLLIVVLIGAGLVFDGGRALAARRQAINTAEAAARAGVATITADGLRDDTARAATLDFLDAARVAPTDIVSITITPTTVTVVLTARRDAVFGQLIGNDSIVVRGIGEATATFGAGP